MLGAGPRRYFCRMFQIAQTRACRMQCVLGLLQRNLALRTSGGQRIASFTHSGHDTLPLTVRDRV